MVIYSWFLMTITIRERTPWVPRRKGRPRRTWRPRRATPRRPWGRRRATLRHQGSGSEGTRFQSIVWTRSSCEQDTVWKSVSNFPEKPLSILDDAIILKNEVWEVAGSITFQQHVFDSVPYLIVQLPNCLIAGFLPNFAILFHFLKKSFFWYGFNLKGKKWKVPFLCEIYRKHVRLVARFAVCQHGQHCLDMVSYMPKVSKMNAGNVVIS